MVKIGSAQELLRDSDFVLDPSLRSQAHEDRTLVAPNYLENGGGVGGYTSIAVGVDGNPAIRHTAEEISRPALERGLRRLRRYRRRLRVDKGLASVRTKQRNRVNTPIGQALNPAPALTKRISPNRPETSGTSSG